MTAVALPAGRRPASRLWSRFRRDRLATGALGVLVAIVAVVVLGPLLVDLDPFTIDLLRKFEGASGEHWFGTDGLGRDLLARLVVGGRTSLGSALLAVSVALVAGVPLGLAAGYLGGVVDLVLNRISDAIMSVPFMITAIAVVAVLGPGLTNAMLAVGVALSPRFFRVTRAATIDVGGETYVEAARSLGCRPRRIMWVHVFPMVLSPLVVQVSLAFGGAILAEAGLSYLGLGAAPPDPSWGVLLRDAAEKTYDAPFMVVPPGLAVTVTVLCLSLVGDAVRDALGGRRAVEVDR